MSVSECQIPVSGGAMARTTSSTELSAEPPAAPPFELLLSQLDGAHREEVSRLKQRLECVCAQNATLQLALANGGKHTATGGGDIIPGDIPKGTERCDNGYQPYPYVSGSVVANNTTTCPDWSSLPVTTPPGMLTDNYDSDDAATTSSYSPRVGDSGPPVPPISRERMSLIRKEALSSLGTQGFPSMEGITGPDDSPSKAIVSAQLSELQVRPEWDEVWAEGSSPKIKGGSKSSFINTCDLESDGVPALLDDYNGCLKHVISYPGSNPRLAMDFAGAILIFCDIVMIPLGVFSPPKNLFTTTVDWVTLIFWTINMLLSPFVGYVKEGITIMTPKKILMNYIKTWLIVDCLVIVPDWVFTMGDVMSDGGGGNSSAGSSVKLLRILRLVRMVRLLRLLKLRKVLQAINEMIDSEYLSIVMNIVKMILALLVINHAIACLWFSVASQQDGDGVDTWIKVHHFERSYTDWTYQYATSFHWSITQFTPSSMSVQPQNITERAFALIVVVFALVGFSYLVGSITGSLTQLRSMQEDATKQFWILRKFLKQNKIGAALNSRIQKYLEHASQRQKKVLAAKDIKIFNLLSDQLKAELQSELEVPHLQIHPMFKHLKNVSDMTLHRLCNKAISRKLLASNDYLFFAGERATHMYIVIEGRLSYTKFNTDGNQERKEQVDKGEDWISEPVLWTTSWTHLGQLLAIQEAELLLIQTAQFIEIMKLNPPAYRLACTYAKHFLAWLRELPPSKRSDITQGEDVGSLIHQFMEVEEPQPMVKQRTEVRRSFSFRACSARSGMLM